MGRPLLVAASNHNLKTLSDVSLILDGTTIFASSVIRNLGVMLESDMSMTSHVASISSSTNYHLRNIARIRRFIDKDTWKQAVRALITSRLDYCNSLLIIVTAKNIEKLQKIQNRSARLIFFANRRDNTSPLIKNSTGYQSKNGFYLRLSCLCPDVSTTRYPFISLNSCRFTFPRPIYALDQINLGLFPTELPLRLGIVPSRMLPREYGTTYLSQWEDLPQLARSRNIQKFTFFPRLFPK